MVKKCPSYQFFHLKKCSPSPPLHPVVAIVPFSKWGSDFMQCKPTSARGHGYIIVVVGYFTKWDEAMPTFTNDGKSTTLLVFN